MGCRRGGQYRERIYSPVRTLMLFLEQVLSADHSCQDATARGVSAQVALGQKSSSLNNAAYCDARQRLPLGLPTRLAREVGARFTERQPAEWLWRGRQVKRVDGTTVSMPDTTENQASFPQSRVQKAGLGAASAACHRGEPASLPTGASLRPARLPARGHWST